MLKFKTVREHLGSLIFALLLLGGGWTMIVRESNALTAKQEDVNRQALNNEKESLELRNRENALAQKEHDIAALQAALQAKLAAADQKERTFEAEVARISPQTNLANQRAKIESLEHEYTTLGVNVAAEPPCGDKDRMDKYNRGRALLDEIVTRAESIHEYSSVQGFLSRAEGFSADVDPCRTEALLHQ